MTISTGGRPRAVTMWDFSWLERRWAGAGYEEWDLALAELADRGYDLVRIDAYPHLVSADAERAWTLLPFWNQQAWGAQSVVTVQVMPALLDFIRTARRHGIAVMLSTWFRRDVDDVRMGLRTPAELARAWIDTLRRIDDAGLGDAVVAVDLCNEFPLPPWAPFLYGVDEGVGLPRSHPRIGAWMRESVEVVRAAFPDFDYTYSFSGTYEDHADTDVASFDFLEPHIWMAGTSDYYAKVGYDFERFSPVGYDNVVRRGKQVYLAEQDRFDASLFAEIDRVATWSRAAGIPVVTTECWSIIDYKDWPGLEWDWVKDLNERAVQHAASTGRWVAMATSNFCGPQFVELWRDVEHHRRLTAVIRGSAIDEGLVADARPSDPAVGSRQGTR